MQELLARAHSQAQPSAAVSLSGHNTRSPKLCENTRGCTDNMWTACH